MARPVGGVLAASILTGVLVAMVPLGAGPAAAAPRTPVGGAAATCPDAGGVPIPRAAARGDVVFHGGGWGHGLGMSQYGAEGAARLGCTFDQILTRYYAGTQVVPAAMPESLRLRLLDDGDRVDVHAVDGALTWLPAGCAEPAIPPLLPTPPPPPTPTTPTTPPAPVPPSAACPPVQPPGAQWRLGLTASADRFVLSDVTAKPAVTVWKGGTPGQRLRLRQDGVVAHLTTRRGTSVYLDRWLRWDWTGFTLAGGRIDAVQHIETSPEGSAMDKYLWGVAEVPASFPVEALKAQAVAARTYAAKRAGRVLLPTPADQNYTGWARESEGPGGQWGATWRAAVDATSGLVVSAPDGSLIDAFYSSSMGGHTEDERYVWGLEAPFLRAVDDSRWDLASSNPPQHRSWAVAMSWETVASRLGFESVSTVSVPPRGSEARASGVQVRGVRGGTVTTTYAEGWDVRQAFGLLSPGFTISMTRTGGTAAQPLAGDWDGDGRDEPGWFRDGAVALRMTSDSGTWVKRFRYGAAGDVAVVGDWDGDGRDDLGVFRAGTWLLRTGLTAGAPTTSFAYGQAGDVPVVGSWRAGRVGIGVVRDGRWLLRRTPTPGAAQRDFRYGAPGDVPVVGSWRGSGRSAIGVFRAGQWLVRHGRSAGPASLELVHGLAGDRPVVGDWDGDGDSTIGVVRRRTFALLSTLGPDAETRSDKFRG